MVIFTGGSWGVGEWKYNQLSGLGVANFFNEQDIAVNLCRSGTSASKQLSDLEDFLSRYSKSDADTIYWLVHNPLVGASPEEIYCNCATLVGAIQEQLHKYLAMANDMAHRHNTVVHLVGASCDLDTVDLGKFDRLILKLPSWGKLLAQDYPASIVSHQADHLTNLKTALETHRPELLEEYYSTLSNIAFKKRKFMQKNEDMFHSFHPTTLGHRILAKYLQTN